MEVAMPVCSIIKALNADFFRQNMKESGHTCSNYLKTLPGFNLILFTSFDVRGGVRGELIEVAVLLLLRDNTTSRQLQYPARSRLWCLHRTSAGSRKLVSRNSSVIRPVLSPVFYLALTPVYTTHQH